MRRLKMGNRTVGPGQPVFVIAEIGVNHDGSVQRALDLVQAATAAGADAVKLQLFSAQNLMHTESELAGYQQGIATDAAAMLRQYELAESAVRLIVQTIRQAGLIPLATPFSPADVELIESLELPAIKIASPDLVNRPLLQRCAQRGKPLLISTGAATMDEVTETMQWLQGHELALLHCISSYPALPESANLCWIGELAKKFDVPIGYSDHTMKLACGALAVAAGACIVEKHLTYDRNAAGPDHACSADPAQFADYVRQIRNAERLRGMPGKRVLEIEQDVRRVSRQSLVLRRAVAAGQTIQECDLTVQRPGTGIPAGECNRIVGMRLTQHQPAGTLLKWDMLAA